MSKPAVAPGSASHSLPAETVERLRHVFVKFTVVLVAALFLPTIGLGLAVATYRETATGISTIAQHMMSVSTIVSVSLLIAAAMTAHRSLTTNRIGSGTLQWAATLTRLARLLAVAAILSGLAATVTATRHWAAWLWPGMLCAAIFWPALTWYAGRKLQQTVRITRDKVTTEVGRGIVPCTTNQPAADAHAAPGAGVLARCPMQRVRGRGGGDARPGGRGGEG